MAFSKTRELGTALLALSLPKKPVDKAQIPCYSTENRLRNRFLESVLPTFFMVKRSTISDVARMADVSKSTVSHVVNNTRYVEDETRQRVLTAIDTLAYRPSSAARSLTTKRTGTAGMIISDASNFFFSEMLRGVEDLLLPRSYSLTVCNTDEVLEREARYLDLLLQQRVDGIIAATSQRWSALMEA